MTIKLNNSPSFYGSPANLLADVSKNVAKKPTSVIKNIPKGIVIDSNFLTSFLRKVNQNVSSPEQRLIMGVTALASQPFIDLNNKRVNEETRLMSFSRTLSKIIVGTTVGVLVRKGCIKLAGKQTKINILPKSKGGGFWGHRKEKNGALAPDYIRTYTQDFHRNYINALGSVLGIGVSLITNFLIDAPLTQIMTNRIYKNITDLSNVKNEEEKEKNLLVIAMKGKQKSNKNINFTGNLASKIAKVASEDIPKIKIVRHEKYIPNEFVDPIFSDIRGLKQWFWKRTSKDPSGMLMHTGALGWAASSAAQITGIALNEKIDTNKKKFLIPQEFADATGNIALYYLITLSTKKFVENLFESGKLRIKNVMDRIESEAKEKGVTDLGEIFGKKTPVADHLSKLIKAKSNYLAHKNGASIVATLIASVISCNVLTPYIRNRYGAFYQEKSKEKSVEINTKLFNIEILRKKNNAFKTPQPKVFANKFIV